MIEPPLSARTPKQLLQLTGAVIDELIARGINRGGNNPLSDYTEWLVAKRYGWQLAPPSEQGYDLDDTPNGQRYEVKARRISKRNPSKQLSAIRSIDAQHFHFLIAAIYEPSYEIRRVMKIPWKVVKEKGRIATHTNSITLIANDELLKISDIVDLTDDFKGFEPLA